MTHLKATDDVLETVSLYVLGTLPAEERAAFEQHLADGCRTCEREVAALAPVVGELSLAAPTLMPRAAVRERLLARLASPWTVVRADEGGWERDASGLEVRRLHRAPEGRVTSLVRMPSGTRYPSHRKALTEELYILAGDLTVEGERLGAGDYCAAATGTMHHETVSQGGCTFVLATSEWDEVVLQSPARSAPDVGLTFVRAAEGGWRPGVVPGVEIRRLYRDRRRGTVTELVRMAAGTRLPGHRHITSEEFYMLSGDAQIAGERLNPGDYYRAAAGTSHDVTFTVRGCEFLLISSAVETLA